MQYTRLVTKAAKRGQDCENKLISEERMNNTPTPEHNGAPQRQPIPRPSGAHGGMLKSKKKSKKNKYTTVIGRFCLVFFTVVFFVVFTLFAVLQTIATGPSETVRDLLVLSAMQASATKWVPGLFLDDAVVDEIVSKSEDVKVDVIPMDSLVKPTPTPDTDDSVDTDNTPSTDGEATDESTPPPTVDEWADAIDGMKYETYTGTTYKAYILLVKDPSRLMVGTSSDYKSGKKGMRIFDIAEKYGAIAAINAGEFSDTNGQGTGDNPIGLTYSQGECVWDDGAWRTFIGFDKNNNLIAKNKMTREEADLLGIRDAVSFQTGNVLISNDGVSVSLHYAEGNTGTAQRTAIGQRADGTVILIVTDGRTASSLGATRNDIIDLMLSYGAVTAGMLDGGSSAMMYYKDYYTKYGIDTSGFDEYQLQGLTNRYKAFTKPRRMPTYFLVMPE